MSELIKLLGGTATAWPLAVRAQTAQPVVGYLAQGSPEGTADTVQLRAVVVEYRWAEGRNDKFPALLADLIGRQVAVIVAPTTPAVLAAKTATNTIPIVFFTAGDPVDLGLVTSLNLPDRNLTGATTLTLEVGPKWLQLLHDTVPSATSLALLINPTSPNLAETQARDMQAAAHASGLQLHVLRASTVADLDTVFASIAQLGAGGLVISSDSFFFGQSKQLATLAVRHAVPTIFGFREFVTAGGLMSYGGSLTESFRWVGIYTGQILKGAKPADLPVQRSTKIELFINLLTAQALGIESAAHATYPRRGCYRMNWLDVRFWHKADITTVFQRCLLLSEKRTSG